MGRKVDVGDTIVSLVDYYEIKKGTEHRVTGVDGGCVEVMDPENKRSVLTLAAAEYELKEVDNAPQEHTNPPNEMHTHASGAIRESKVGKGSPSTMLCGFPYTLTVLHKHMENPLGRNWENGLPTSGFIDAAFRHLLEEVSGNGDEDAIVSAVWNLMCYMETKHRVAIGSLPDEVDDLDRTPHSEVIYG